MRESEANYHPIPLMGEPEARTAELIGRSGRKSLSI